MPVSAVNADVSKLPTRFPTQYGSDCCDVEVAHDIFTKLNKIGVHKKMPGKLRIRGIDVHTADQERPRHCI
jgi:hypothetical protein